MISIEKFKENKWFVAAVSSAVLLGSALAVDIYKSYKKKESAKFDKFKRIQEGEIPGTPISNMSNHLFLRSKLPDDNLQTRSDIPIYKLCITGGPSGGKTTGKTFASKKYLNKNNNKINCLFKALALLSEKLSERGFQVLMVPKVSALTLENGGMVSIENLTTDQAVKFEVKKERGNNRRDGRRIFF